MKNTMKKTTFLVLPWVLVFLVKPVSAQGPTTDAMYVWGPDKAQYASVGGGIDMQVAHIYGGYAVRMTQRGESFYYGGLKLFPLNGYGMRVHVGPLYRLSVDSAESEWLVAAGLEIGYEFVLFADIYMEPGGFEKQFISTGFRLPLIW